MSFKKLLVPDPDLDRHQNIITWSLGQWAMPRDTRNSFSTKNERNRKIRHSGRKTKFTILDEIWTENGQLPKKIVKFFHIHWHYHKEWIPRIIGMQMD